MTEQHTGRLEQNVMQWRDIATAPKDGTEILLYSHGDQSVCYWREDAEMTGWTWGCGMMFRAPTHWMPLPAAPDPA